MLWYFMLFMMLAISTFYVHKYWSYVRLAWIVAKVTLTSKEKTAVSRFKRRGPVEG